MLWVAALLSLIVWAIGWESGFLGPVVHVFLLLALLAVLAALLPPREGDGARELAEGGAGGANATLAIAEDAPSAPEARLGSVSPGGGRAGDGDGRAAPS